MAEKPAIFFAMVPGWFRSCGFEIIAVTTERGGQIYGRDHNGCATHRRSRDVVHRFNDKAIADTAADRAIAKQKELQPAVTEARKEWQRLDQEMSAAILAAAKGEAT